MDLVALQNVGSSQTRDGIHVPYIGRHSYPLYTKEEVPFSLFNIENRLASYSHLAWHLLLYVKFYWPIVSAYLLTLSLVAFLLHWQSWYRDHMVCPLQKKSATTHTEAMKLLSKFIDSNFVNQGIHLLVRKFLFMLSKNLLFQVIFLDAWQSFGNLKTACMLALISFCKSVYHS